MLITSAFAQTAGGAAAGQSFGQLFVPLFLIMGIMYFFMIRPQQKKAKEHATLVSAVRRGDQIISSGGLLGKITKATDGSPDVEVEIAEGVKIKLLRSAIIEVTNQKTETKTETK